MASHTSVFFALFLLSACDPEALQAETGETFADDYSWDARYYPREVIVSPSHEGLGFATWMGEGPAAKAFAEDDELVDMVKAGLHLSEVAAFQARVIELGGHIEPNYPWLDLEIQTAKGPYILESVGGSERILERSEVQWW